MAVDFFLARFKVKTSKELQSIIAGEDFTSAAKEAAQIILKERQALGQIEESVEEVINPSALPPAPPLPVKKMGIHPFDPLPYLHSLGLKDVFSILSVSMLLLAIIQLSRYYNHEPDLNISKNIITAILIIFALLLGHVFYKRDHKRSNNYLGRCISDVLLFIVLAIYISLVDATTNRGYFYPFFADFGAYVAFFILFFFGALIFESIVSLFKFLLRSLKWKIL